MNRPLESEYAPYYQGYVAHVTEDEILPVLRSQLDALDVLLNRVAPEQETFRYAEGKWSIREVIGLLSELRLVRLSNIAMLRNLNDEAWLRTGIANDSPVSVRALAFIMAGHARHHMGVLSQRYHISGAR